MINGQQTSSPANMEAAEIVVHHLGKYLLVERSRSIERRDYAGEELGPPDRNVNKFIAIIIHRQRHRVGEVKRG